jgi:hypothetical protein
MGRLPLNPLLLLLLMILLPALFTPKKMTFWSWTHGNDSSRLPNDNRSSFAWSTKPSSVLIVPHQSTSTYGFEVPKDYQHVIRLDEKAGNTKWQDSAKLEMAQLDDYDMYKDYGHSGKPPDGYKKIRVHLIIAVKHDGRHKSRLICRWTPYRRSD